MKILFHYNSIKMPIINHKLVHNPHYLSNRVLYIPLHTWNSQQHSKTKQPTLLLDKSTSFWRPYLILKGVCTNLLLVMPKHLNIPTMYLHCVESIVWSCQIWFICISKKYWISHKFTISNFFKKENSNSFNKIKSLEAKIKPLTYKVMITKRFPWAF